MKIKEAIPLFERTLEAMKAMPEDVEIISVDGLFYASEQYASIHVAEADGIRQLAKQYGRCLRRTVEDPNEYGTVWTWLRFSSPDNFLRFLHCEAKAAPSDATTGDGGPDGQQLQPHYTEAGKESQA